ncbi:MAG: PPOX class F420-dependent oxidoreductase [Candidatus Dormibacteria bacterium]
MTPEEARDFIRQNHRSVLATRRRDGGAQLSPVLAAVDPEGRVVVSTREASVKVRNLRRQPRCNLLAFSDGFFGPWVAVAGTAEVVSLPEALPLLERYYRDAVGEHPDWDEYRSAMVKEGRVLVRITVEEVGPKTGG